MPPHIVAGLGAADVSTLGITSEEDYLRAYCRRRALDGMPGYDFYVAFNFFRLAAIFHGIKGRVLRGTASSEQARDRVAVLPELIELAWKQARRAGA
jgi:aminoglycoside phosphotransferase (APT) family kinase protein